MPHLNLKTKETLRSSPNLACSLGDFNFLYTVAYLQHWLKEGNQRYAQIHKLRYASMQPATIEEVKKVEDTLTLQNVSIMDRIIARDLAWGEFKRLVVDPYEEYCTFKNGMVEEYLLAIQAQNKLGEILSMKEIK